MQVEMAEDLKLNGMVEYQVVEGLSHQRKARFQVQTIRFNILIMLDANGE